MQSSYTVVEKIYRTNCKILICGKHQIYHMNLPRKYDRAVGHFVHLLVLAVVTEVEGEASIAIEYSYPPKKLVRRWA